VQDNDRAECRLAPDRGGIPCVAAQTPHAILIPVGAVVQHGIPAIRSIARDSLIRSESCHRACVVQVYTR